MKGFENNPDDSNFYIEYDKDKYPSGNSDFSVTEFKDLQKRPDLKDGDVEMSQKEIEWMFQKMLNTDDGDWDPDFVENIQ